MVGYHQNRDWKCQLIPAGRVCQDVFAQQEYSRIALGSRCLILGRAGSAGLLAISTVAGESSNKRARSQKGNGSSLEIEEHFECEVLKREKLLKSESRKRKMLRCEDC